MTPDAATDALPAVPPAAAPVPPVTPPAVAPPPPVGPAPPDAERQAAPLPAAAPPANRQRFDLEPLTLTPPHDVEIEQAVLGAMLQDQDAMRVGLRELLPGDFADPVHGGLFHVLVDVTQNRESDEPPLDFGRLMNILRTVAPDLLELLGGQSGILGLCDIAPCPGNVHYYAKIIRALAARRRMMQAAQEVMRTAADPRTDPASLAVLAQAVADAAKPIARHVEPKTLRQLRTAYPVLRPAVLHGLLREGETLNVIAPSKGGKSWLTCGLAVTVAAGPSWLDRFPVERGAVLIVDNELHPETVSDRLLRVAEARGIAFEDVADRITVLNLRGHLTDLYGLRPLFDSFQAGRFKILIIDSLYRLLPAGADENSNCDMMHIYNALDTLADRLKCAIVAIHHSSKGWQGDKAITDVGSGAGSISRAVDGHLILRPHKEKDAFVLEAAVRNWPPVEPFCLRWLCPLFTPDSTLDPADLRRGGRLKADDKPVKSWTPETFTSDFAGPDPRPKAAILVAAKAGGLSERQAKNLLEAAESRGLLFRWSFEDRRKVFCATVPQPELTPETDR